MKTELRMEMMSVMLSIACSVLGRNENLLKHCFSPFLTVFPVFSVFHGHGGELVRAVAVTLQPWSLVTGGTCFWYKPSLVSQLKLQLAGSRSHMFGISHHWEKLSCKKASPVTKEGHVPFVVVGSSSWVCPWFLSLTQSLLSHWESCCSKHAVLLLCRGKRFM